VLDGILLILDHNLGCATAGAQSNARIATGGQGSRYTRSCGSLPRLDTLWQVGS
jgi:hypothetical protein